MTTPTPNPSTSTPTRMTGKALRDLLGGGRVLSAEMRGRSGGTRVYYVCRLAFRTAEQGDRNQALWNAAYGMQYALETGRVGGQVAGYLESLGVVALTDLLADLANTCASVAEVSTKLASLPITVSRGAEGWVFTLAR